MIDFACKRFSLDKIIKCSLGLSKADAKVMHFLLGHNSWTTAKELAKKTDLNLSTVQRAIKKLYEKDAVIRSQENLDNGGYLFHYKIKDKKALRNIIMQLVKGWLKTIEKELERW